MSGFGKELSDEELKQLGDDLLLKIQSFKQRGEKVTDVEKLQSSAELFLIDKELIARGFKEYIPIVEDYENRLKLEREHQKNESAGLIGIGLVVFVVTLMLDQGFSLDALAVVVEIAAVGLIIGGSLWYNKKTKILYCA